MDDQNKKNEMVSAKSRNRAIGLLALALISGFFSAEIVARPQVYAVNDTIEAVFGSPPEYIGTTATGDLRFAAYQGDDPSSLISYLLLYQEGTSYVGAADLEDHIRSFVETQARSVSGSTIHFSFGRIGDEVGAYFTIQYQYRNQVAVKNAVAIYRSGKLYQWAMDYYPGRNKGSPKLFSRYAESFKVEP